MNLNIKSPLTRDEAISLLGEIRLITIRRNQVLLEREMAVKEIDDRVNPVIAACDELIGGKAALLRAWSENNSDAFSGAQSISCLHGEFGFRVGNPSLKPLAALNWDKILHTLKHLFNGDRYIRTVEEVDKRAILGDREALGSENLKKIGVKIVQEKTFFIAPKLEEA